MREPHPPPCGDMSRLPLVPCAETFSCSHNRNDRIKHILGDPLAERQRCTWPGYCDGPHAQDPDTQLRHSSFKNKCRSTWMIFGSKSESVNCGACCPLLFSLWAMNGFYILRGCLKSKTMCNRYVCKCPLKPKMFTIWTFTEKAYQFLFFPLWSACHIYWNWFKLLKTCPGHFFFLKHSALWSSS